jgi:hypothetical protein
MPLAPLSVTFPVPVTSIAITSITLPVFQSEQGGFGQKRASVQSAPRVHEIWATPPVLAMRTRKQG